jgi:hypothetical protein
MISFQSDQKLRDWLLAHKDQILTGGAEYHGVKVTDSTVLTQFDFVASFLIITLSGKSQHLLPGDPRRNLRTTAWMCSGLTLVLGWWGFPWGPPYTIWAVISNLRGGHKRTVASLLQKMEWGWDAPENASATGHQKKIMEVSEAAAREIRGRIAKGGFRDDVGVRITLTNAMAGEVRVSFGYPVSDGGDWVDYSQGLLLLIAKDQEAQLSGSHLDLVDGKFVARIGFTPK